MANFNLNLTPSINETTDDSNLKNYSVYDIVALMGMTIASVGIISNFTVVAVFMNQVKLRRKIPIIYIINRVNIFNDFITGYCVRLRLLILMPVN